MSILDRAEVNPTSNRKVDEFIDPVSCVISTEKTGAERPGLDANEEYELTLRVHVRFWANRVQYEHAAKVAREVAADRLFGPIHPLLRVAEMEILSGRKKEALAAIQKIRDEIK